VAVAAAPVYDRPKGDQPGRNVVHVFATMMAGILAVFCLMAGDARAQVDAAIRELVARWDRDGALEIADASLKAKAFVSELYARRDHAPLWTDPTAIDALVAAIAESRADGLRPRDFHAAAIARLRPADDDGGRAALDVLLTDAAVNLFSQLRRGKVNPSSQHPHLNVAAPVIAADPVAAAAEIIRVGAVESTVDLLRPKHPFYLKLRAALARYRELAAAGGWPTVESGPALRAGDAGPRVGALRARLAVMDASLAVGPGDDDIFDTGLEAAVDRFQRAHGLEPDGIVGPATLAALNVSAEARVDQIRVNLERARWVLNRPLDRAVIVNIAGFRVLLMADGEMVWEARAIIGKTYTRTPVFLDEIEYLEVNPTWSVPASIAERTIRPRLQQGAATLEREGFVGYDARGNRVPLTRAARFVQMPGPDNALGRIKFMFPNPYAVYLHDTPARDLFDRAQRSFSAGCIRVEHPFDLAERLLAAQDGWDRARLDALVASGERRRIDLEAPMPVAILYWTVDPAPEGGVVFYNDIYERDAPLLAALDAP
jgi:murein L,D-transpeptidase YcbB/YkuD